MKTFKKIGVMTGLCLALGFSTHCSKKTKEDPVVDSSKNPLYIYGVNIQGALNVSIKNDEGTINFQEGNQAVLLNETDPNKDFILGSKDSRINFGENEDEIDINDVDKINYVVEYQADKKNYTLTIDVSLALIAHKLDLAEVVAQDKITISSINTEGKGTITIFTNQTIDALNLGEMDNNGKIKKLKVHNQEVKVTYSNQSYTLARRGKKVTYEVKVVNPDFLIETFKVGQITGTVDNQTITITEGKDKVLNFDANNFSAYITFKTTDVANRKIENIKGYIDETEETDLNKANKITFDVVIGQDFLTYTINIDVENGALGLKEPYATSTTTDGIIKANLTNNTLLVVKATEDTEVKFEVINPNTEAELNVAGNKLTLTLRGETKEYEYKEETVTNLLVLELKDNVNASIDETESKVYLLGSATDYTDATITALFKDNNLYTLAVNTAKTEITLTYKTKDAGTKTYAIVYVNPTITGVNESSPNVIHHFASETKRNAGLDGHIIVVGADLTANDFIASTHASVIVTKNPVKMGTYTIIAEEKGVKSAAISVTARALTTEDTEVSVILSENVLSLNAVKKTSDLLLAKPQTNKLVVVEAYTLTVGDFEASSKNATILVETTKKRDAIDYIVTVKFGTEEVEYLVETKPENPVLPKK